MVFVQFLAPIGWKAEATDDRALKIVAAGGGATGGTDAFSTTFSAAKETDSHQLTEAEMPAHTHTGPPHTHSMTIAATKTAGLSYQNTPGTDALSTSTHNTSSAGTGATGSKGGDGAHTHTMTMDVHFIGVLHCTKQ